MHVADFRKDGCITMSQYHNNFIIIISLLKTHVRCTCLHDKNITNETHKQRVILIKKESKIGLR